MDVDLLTVIEDRERDEKPKKKKKSKHSEDKAAAGSKQKEKKAFKAATEASVEPSEPKEKKRKREKATEDHATPAKETKKAKKEKKSKSIQSPATLASDASDDTAVMSGDDSAAASPPKDPLSVENFPLSPEIKAALKGKGITSLFDIQAQTLSHVLGGKDVLGRARTGCGKTLAFVLPIIERLQASAGSSRPHGRHVSVIVLAPTRELAKQVHADFQFIGSVFKFAAVCMYGGSAYQPQEAALRRGADIVVGTPGRVKDMIEKGTLKLDRLVFRVLDECDEMLNMGFVDDVETILNAGGSSDIQTLLFSATLPSWVKDIQKRFLKPDFKLVDLVGNEKQKASTSVKHLVLPCHWSQRASVAADCIRTYGATGRTIVFTDTKKDANEMASTLETFNARALHGDIPQGQREVTLAGFRANRFQVLVATDVAARGLDISGVELVVQCEPPKDPEQYIHRSGRTGRAGCTGVSLTLVDKKKEGLIPFIEKRAGFKFERIGAPQPADMARIAGERAGEALKEVDDSVIPWFRAAAKQLLEELEDPEAALARALAKITGHTQLHARSLITSHEDFTTLMYHSSTEIQKPGLVWAYLKRQLPDSVVEEVQRLSLTKDNMAAIFDVPSKRAKEFLNKCRAPEGVNEEVNLAQGKVPHQPYLSLPTKLPELKERETFIPSHVMGGRGGFSAGRGGFSGSRGGRGFGSSRGGGRGGSSGGHSRGNKFGQGSRHGRNSR